MNPFLFPEEREARVRFVVHERPERRVVILEPGTYVTCAVSGARIPLPRLLYWSVLHQEAYAGPAEALQRLREKGEL